VNVNIPRSSQSSAGRVAGVALLIALGLIVLHAQAVDPSIHLGDGCGPLTQPQKPEITYAAKPGDTVGPNSNPALNAQIPVKDLMGNTFPNDVFWSLGTALGCAGASPSIQCAPNAMNTDHVFNVVAPSGQVSPATSAGWVQITNARAIAAGDVGRTGSFTATVAQAPGGDPICTWNYQLRVTANGGGWGDPHITTVDGVAYDFQSAGEFTSLREDRLEVQTRQTAVPTASIPNANPYTGLASCVSIYTAVAARIGKNRVTLQPDASGEPSPNRGMQLRVNGQPVSLGDNGIDLPGDAGLLDGRIVPVGAAYQITDRRGTQLVVTPAFWDSQQKWYLNVNVNQTTATAGVMGRLAERSWLPALPDGTSLGPIPESLNQRYQQLYEQFADAWRVTDATSLFDYAPGTNTATFTLDEWPRSNPKSCALEGQNSATPATPEVAVEACKGVTDAAQRADCVFDVTFTGHTGFGQSYEAMQNVRPHGTGWQPPLLAQIPVPLPHGLPWWVWLLILILVLTIIIVLFLRKKTA
jgi:von Willebrand factor type D domain